MMKKMAFAILLCAFCIQNILSDDRPCFTMNGQKHCNNDVYEIFKAYFLLKVYDAGLGQVRWELYQTMRATTDPQYVASEASDFFYSKFRLGAAKKILEDTPESRKKFEEAKKKRQKAVEEQIRLFGRHVGQCKKGAIKNGNGDKEATSLLLQLCKTMLKREVDVFISEAEGEYGSAIDYYQQVENAYKN